MPVPNVTTLEVKNRRAWRSWLHEHHASEAEIWLVFHKRHTGETSIPYEDAVEEALCYGWIDSLVRRLDEDRYARKFTPRRPGSVWSTINRRRYASLKARGLLAAPGLERAPTGRSGDAPRPSPQDVPVYIMKALRASPPAWEEFERSSPSARRLLIGWIDSAKREETRKRRLREAIALLEAGKKLGLK